MDNIFKYILIAVILFFIAQLILHFIKSLHEAIKKRIEQKKLEKEKWKFAKVDENNVLLNEITQSRFIIIKGDWGKGKSILMNIIAKFLYKKKEVQDNENKRYLKFIKPDYLEQLEKIDEEKKLPIYSNLDFKDVESGKVSQDLEPYIKLQKKAVPQAIFCIDEVASIFPKTMHYQNMTDENKEVVEQKELFKKFRHYTNGWIIGTEQDGQDIYVGFRKNGYVLITALGTVVKLTKWGKFKRLILNSINIFMPALLTINVRLERKKVLFKEDLFKFYLKLLLPAYFSFPVNFYERKQKISNYINKKHQKYITKFEYNGKQYFFKYTNKEKFSYNTRAYKNEYDEKFDNNGNRKETRTDNKDSVKTT